MDAAITSKPVQAQATGEPMNNGLKAIKEESDSGALEGSPQRAGKGSLAVQEQEDERAASGSDNASRGSFESVGMRSSRAASVSSAQRGSRISAFGWIAGKIGLSEARKHDEVGLEPAHPSKPESDVHAFPEEPDRSLVRSSGTNPQETLVGGQETIAAMSASAGGVEGTEPALPKAYSAKSSLETEVDRSETRITTISWTRTPDHESNAPDRVDERREAAVAVNEVPDPSSGYERSLEEAQPRRAHTAPTHQSGADTQNEPEFEHRQQHQVDVVYNEETSGVHFHHDHSTASLRTESFVGTAADHAGSETTLDIEPDLHHDQHIPTETQDENTEGGFGLEQQAADNVRLEISDTGHHGPRSDGRENGSQLLVVPKRTDGTNTEGDILSPGLDQVVSPTTHASGQGNSTLDSHHSDERYGMSADVDHPSNAEQVLEGIRTGRSVPQQEGPMDGTVISAVSEASVHELLGLDHALNHGPAELSIQQEHKNEMTSPSAYTEHEYKVGEVTASGDRPSTDVIESAAEPTAGEPLQCPELEEEPEVSQAIEEYLSIELPPPALEYSLASGTVQLPNGTWTTGILDEGLFESLAAKFLVPTVSSEYSEPGDTPPAQQSREGEDLDAPGVGGRSNIAISCPCKQSSGTELVGVVYPTFAHEIQPVAVQLATGAWSIDPRDGEFEDVWLHSQRSQNAVPSAFHSPAFGALENDHGYTRNESPIQDAVFSIQPVTMQMPSGAWVADPSEEYYNAALVQTLDIDPPSDHVESTADSRVPSFSDPQDVTPSDDIRPPPSTGLDASALLDSERSPQEANEEQTSSVPEPKLGNQGEPVAMEETDVSPGRELSEEHDKYLSHGGSLAAIRDGTALPWSPFNSRTLLSPEGPPATADQPLQLDEAYEAEKGGSAVAANPAGRHATFGYGNIAAGPEQVEYQAEDIPNTPLPHTNTLNSSEEATESESQNFVAPLQSAGWHSPQAFQGPPDTFHNAVDYVHIDAPQQETATTVNGQDELFDSDSASEYEPYPGVDENGDPRANLGMPPQHHAFANGPAGEPTDSPNTAILRPAGDTLLQRTPEMPPALEDNSDVNPISLRQASPQQEPPRRGLAFSRHNPVRPATPPAQTIPADLSSYQGAWDASGPVESTPMSLVSRSTLSSSPDSPVGERIHDGCEPAIQNSWSEDIHGEQYGHQDDEGEHEPTPAQDAKFEENLPTPIATHMPESVRDYSPATPSPSALIQKMRSIFENPRERSPASSRPSSGIFNPPRPLESPGYDVPGESRKGGFLNEAEDEVDERSALLGSVGSN